MLRHSLGCPGVDPGPYQKERGSENQTLPAQKGQEGKDLPPMCVGREMRDPINHHMSAKEETKKAYTERRKSRGRLEKRSRQTTIQVVARMHE